MSPWFGRSGCVPKNLGSSPMLAIHWEIRRAVLSRRYRSVPTATSGEEELARLLIGGFDVTVDRLTGMLRHLKPDGLAGLLLAHGRSINSMPVRSNVLPLKLTTSHPRSLLSMARLTWPDRVFAPRFAAWCGSARRASVGEVALRRSIYLCSRVRDLRPGGSHL
jgi:hypothetical protein